MHRKIEYLFAVCLFLGVIFVGVLGCHRHAGAGIAPTVEPDANQESLYKQALALQEEGDYNNASEILKKLVKEMGVSKYEISYLDAVLDQCIAMKESNSSAWKPISNEVQYEIKVLKGTQQGNSDYWLVWAKYSWLVGAKREAHITKALEKAQKLNPNNPGIYILKGDIYADMAKKDDPSEKQEGIGGFETTRHMDSMTAKVSYETALSNPFIDKIQKAYIYYKLGEFKSQVLKDLDDARVDWGKAVWSASESRWGNLAKKRLEK